MNLSHRMLGIVARSALTMVASLTLLVIAVSAITGVQAIIRSQGGDEIYSSSRKDIIQEWLLAKAFQAGVDPYLPIKELAVRFLGDEPRVQTSLHPTPHPPTDGLIFFPLALLDYRTAVHAWLVIELVLLWGGLYFIARALRHRNAPAIALLLIPVMLGWGAVAEELAFGQLVIAQLFTLACAWFLISKGRHGQAGLAVGIGILIKPMLWPTSLFFLVYRKWRGALACAAVLAGGFLASTLALGITGFYRYLVDVLPAVDRIYEASILNLSVRSIGPRLFQGTFSPAHDSISAPPFVSIGPLGHWLGIILPLAVVAGSATATRILKPMTGFCALIGASVLASPVAWGSYLALLSLPIAFIVTSLISRRLPKAQTITSLILVSVLVPRRVLWVNVALAISGQIPTSERAVTLSSSVALITLVPTAATLALLGMVIYLGRRDSSLA